MRAMILAAGLGTRLRPFTNTIPKALVEINGKPLLQHALEHLAANGIREVIINIHHFGEKIVDFLTQKNFFGLDIAISDESDQLLETGGGVVRASWFFSDDKPFLVRNVDVLSDLDLGLLDRYHSQSESLSTLVVRNRATTRYLLFDDRMHLCGWENKQTGERRLAREDKFVKQLAFSGIQIMDPRVFLLITETGGFSLTDLYIRLATDHPIRGFLDTTSFWKDIGRIEDIR